MDHTQRGFRKDIDQLEAAYRRIGQRSLHRQQSVIGPHVHDLHVLGHDVVFQPRLEGVDQAGFEVEEQLLRKGEHMDVRNEPSLGRTERRRTPGSDRQRPDVVGDLSIEEADAIGAGEAESAPESEVKDGDGGPKGPVFGGGIPVVGDDLLATQDGEPSPEGFVCLMQHG